MSFAGIFIIFIEFIPNNLENGRLFTNLFSFDYKT